MRRTAATLIALSLLVLAGCSGGSSDDASSSPSASESSTAAATASAEDVAALEAVTITGDPGAEPTFDFEQPFSVSAAVARVASPGTGDTIAEGQLVTLNLTAVSGTDGTSQGTTYGATPQAYVADDANLPQVMLDALLGQQVGARVLYASPSSDGTDSLIWAFEVVSTQDIPDRAEGTAVTPAEGLPTVTLADDGEPTLTPLDADAPTDLVVQTLIQGSGAALTADQNIVINYSGWLWDGTSFDSSWTSGSPLSTPLSSLIEGWQQGLVGQTVGSQVLLIVPPDLGYGDTDTGTIPGGSTLVFVVDILAAS
ncbi:MAG TPA: FKBP-type peptidyl-prolyl cis-trans isomerase [Cellulomonas sp.]